MNLAHGTDDDLAIAIDQVHCLITAAQSSLVTLVTEYRRRNAFLDDGVPDMRTWLVERLQISYRTAQQLLNIADALPERPTMASAFSAGMLPWDKLKPLIASTSPHDESELTERALTTSVAELEASATTPNTERHPERSYLNMRWNRDHSTLKVTGHLIEADGASMEEVLTKIADKLPPCESSRMFDPYPIRCAEALMTLTESGVAAASFAEPATVCVHAEATEILSAGKGHATLENGITLGPGTLGRIACDARIQLHLHDNDGRPLGIGRTSRQVPRWMLRALRRRDQGCRVPGCGRTRWLVAHHIIHWADGGPTNMNNLVILCGTHHRMLHRTGWTIQGTPETNLTFLQANGTRFPPPTPLRQDIRQRFALPTTEPAYDTS